MRRLRLRAEAHALAAAIRVALRLLPLPRLVVCLARLPRVRRAAAPAACASAAAEAARRAAHSTCLFTALIAFALLARRGYAPQLVIGAARDGGFDAHAWVTVAGTAVTACPRDYVPLWCAPARSEAA